MMDSLLKRVADALMRCGAIKFGEFKLKNGKMSPIYIDLRVLRSFPWVVALVANAFEQMLRKHELEPDLLADIPIASSPFVTVLSQKTGIPMVTPRPAKEHGTKATVEGVFKPDQGVIVFDDLITDAGSKLEAIAALEGKDLVVEAVVVLIDREQGGPQELERQGFTFHSALTLTGLLAYYVETNQIEKSRYDEVVAYLAANT